MIHSSLLENSEKRIRDNVDGNNDDNNGENYGQHNGKLVRNDVKHFAAHRKLPTARANTRAAKTIDRAAKEETGDFTRNTGESRFVRIWFTFRYESNIRVIVDME